MDTKDILIICLTVIVIALIIGCALAFTNSIELPRLVEVWIPGTFKPGQPRCPNG